MARVLTNTVDKGKMLSVQEIRDKRVILINQKRGVRVVFKIALHAVERYIDRIDPRASIVQARNAIGDAFRSARRGKERTSSGDAYYFTDRMRLIVAEEGGSRTVLTVLENTKEKNRREIPELAKELANQYDEWVRSEREPKKHKPALETPFDAPEPVRGKIEELTKAVSRRKRQLADLHRHVDKKKVMGSIEALSSEQARDRKLIKTLKGVR